ncbi:MAG: hypothetical protein AAGA18_12260 [Verrucomicrobiota bacterium]
MRHSPHKFGKSIFVLIILCYFTATYETHAIEFKNQSPIQTDQGHLVLEWPEASSTSEFIIEQSSNPDFSNAIVIYEGAANRTFISGLKEGSTYFRIKQQIARNQWSKPLTVQVNYPIRSKVTLLLTIGTIGLVATILAIIQGHLKARQTSSASAN